MRESVTSPRESFAKVTDTLTGSLEYMPRSISQKDNTRVFRFPAAPWVRKVWACRHPCAEINHNLSQFAAQQSSAHQLVWQVGKLSWLQWTDLLSTLPQGSNKKLTQARCSSHKFLWLPRVLQNAKALSRCIHFEEGEIKPRDSNPLDALLTCYVSSSPSRF